MPVKCVTGGLLFRTCNDLDWHIQSRTRQIRCYWYRRIIEGGMTKS